MFSGNHVYLLFTQTFLFHQRLLKEHIKSSVLFSCYLPSNELLKLHQNLEAIITLSDAQNIERFPVQNWTASDGELNWTGVIVDRVQIDI